MKKLMFLALIAAGIGFTSCSKCQTCSATIDGENYSQEVCQSNYNSKTLYDAAINAMEASGYDCK